jgi:cellobiose-specific phosphotransferase system component IIC
MVVNVRFKRMLAVAAVVIVGIWVLLAAVVATAGTEDCLTQNSRTVCMGGQSTIATIGVVALLVVIVIGTALSALRVARPRH